MSAIIYAGPGTEPQGPKRISKLFERSGLPVPKIVNSAELLITHLKSKAISLLIMPGGRDIPYQKAFKGEPNRIIREFVKEGGNYLGVCAGAYYGCSEIIFEKDGPLEVLEQRELCFFPGAAVGPAYGPNKFSYYRPTGVCIAQLGAYDVLFHGGCAFHNAHLYQNEIHILARYEDIPEKPAAVVGCRVGKGKAILCGVHPEMEAEDLHPETPDYERVKNMLQEGYDARSELVSQWMKWLNEPRTRL